MSTKTATVKAATLSSAESYDQRPGPQREATAQDIEVLRRRYQNLYERKIQAEANKASGEERLAGLKRQAREQFGTDDLEELRYKLREMKAENERRRAEYQQHLAQIEASLEQVAAEHKAAENEDQGS